MNASDSEPVRPEELIAAVKPLTGFVHRCGCGRFVRYPLHDDRGFVRCLVCLLTGEVQVQHDQLF